MSYIIHNIEIINQRIIDAEVKFHRPHNAVKLLAVTKGQSIEKIQQAARAGICCFGENYLQEALLKIRALKDNKIEWHFIGNIQSNKTKLIAENFSWVHSISSYKIAQRLSLARPRNLSPLDVCIEVNVSGEKNKSGIKIPELAELALAISKLPNLRLRGLMTIPAPAENFNQQRKPYHLLQTAFKALQKNGLSLDTLSMGMSNDLEAAIAEGSTMVRVGAAIFGARQL